MKKHNGKVLEIEGEPAGGAEHVNARELNEAIRLWWAKRGINTKAFNHYSKPQTRKERNIMDH